MEVPAPVITIIETTKHFTTHSHPLWLIPLEMLSEKRMKTNTAKPGLARNYLLRSDLWSHLECEAGRVRTLVHVLHHAHSVKKLAILETGGSLLAIFDFLMSRLYREVEA